MNHPVELRIGAPITASALVADIDNDGDHELLVIADQLYAWRLPAFTPLAGYPKRIAGPSASTPVMAHDGPGRQVLVFGSDDDKLYAIDAAGTLLPGYPVTTGGDVFTSPLVADLEQSGKQKVIFGSDDGGLYTIALIDRSASDPAQADRQMTRFATTGFVSSTPALLPRTAGGYDVVFGSWDGGLYCLRGDDPTACRWRVDTGHLIWSSPVIADIDGDGRPEVVVVNDQLHVLIETGQPLAGFPIELDGMGIATAAVGDVEGDGQSTIIAVADRVYAFHADGKPLLGFPVDTGEPFWASPILADVDGDGRDEIVAADYGGWLHVFTAKGKELPGFPRKLGTCIVSSPIAADVDNDRLLELVVCTFDGVIHILPTQGRQSQWPNFRGPLADGIQPRGSSTRRQVPVNPTQPHARGSVNVLEWTIQRKRFARHGLYEIHMQIDRVHNLRRCLLHFQKNGAWHPSPILRNGPRLLGRFPPFPRLAKVSWYVSFEHRDGTTSRFPALGAHHFRAW
jgi:outer membrane protein assembly factor BamB